MKKRILSIVLALCLCFSSQSVVCAGQEDISAESLPEGTEISEEVNIVPEEEDSQSGDVSTKESPEKKETGEEVNTASGEDTSQPEEVLTEESTEVEETSEETDTALGEDASQSAEVFTEESTEEVGEDPETDLQENDLKLEKVPKKRSMSRIATRDVTDLSPAAVYEAVIALKDQDGYREGTTWTNDEPYSGSGYHWNGGTLGGYNIDAVGCVAFAFRLSDEAFGGYPARMYPAGAFTYDDIKVGDILQVNNDAHTVIVLKVLDTGVVVAEGNYSGKVQWGRTIDKEEVISSTSHYITRYPENYVRPDDPDADKTLDSGTLNGGLNWKLTNAGTLTISGSGPMPDFGASDQPWNKNSDNISKVVIGDGVTSIGSCAFWNCKLFSAQISSSVKTIGNNAFRGSPIISVTIPSSVKTIGDSAFYGCQNLSSVTVSDGVETICQNAFYGCMSLKSISLPSSVEEVGAAAFFGCTEMTSATFASGSGQVKMGDNMFTQCYKLMSVKLPQNIDRIGEGMFLDCLMLAGVEIPRGAESIGGHAFSSCSGMSVVVIPDSVTTIGIAAFSACPLTDIYYTGSEAQWNSISKIGDTASAVSKATVHYNYVPVTNPDPDEGDNGDNNTGDNDDGNNGDNNTGDNNDSNNGDNNNTGDSNTGDNSGNNHGSDRPGNNSSEGNSDENTPEAAAWRPTTPDEIKRYDCVGKEAVQYILSEENVYPIDIENAVQGPMCFQVFEFVLGDYTIGRTYNIYALSDITYSTDQEVQITLEIPSALYKKDRDYKMICVTKGGQPYIYDDLDNNPGTITIKTDKFFAYALIYK